MVMISISRLKESVLASNKKSLLIRKLMLCGGETWKKSMTALWPLYVIQCLTVNLS